MMPVKRLSPTDFKCTIPRGAREKTLKKALETDGTMKKWSASAWAAKLKNRKVRSEMTDCASSRCIRPRRSAVRWSRR